LDGIQPTGKFSAVKMGIL